MTAASVPDLFGAVNEAASNAIDHAEGGHVRLWRDGDRLIFELTDTGPGIPATRLRPPRPAVGTLGGWGLWRSPPL